MTTPSVPARAVRLAAAVLVVVAGACSSPTTTTSPAPPTAAPSSTPTLSTPTASPSATMTAGDHEAGDSEAGDSEVDGPMPSSSPNSGDLALPPLHPSVDDYPAGRVVVDRGGDQADLPVVVRLADTPERRSHGLMEVEEVPDGTGMWFTYDEDHTGGFWMKGTRTDLDIAWVDEQGEIVAIETMSVCEADPCEVYDPGTAYRSALEVRSAWLSDNGVDVGDRILSESGQADRS